MSHAYLSTRYLLYATWYLPVHTLPLAFHYPVVGVLAEPSEYPARQATLDGHTIAPVYVDWRACTAIYCKERTQTESPAHRV